MLFLFMGDRSNITNRYKRLTRCIYMLAILPLLIGEGGCKHEKYVTPIALTRSYRMGFQNFAPKPDLNVILQYLAFWTQRADAAIISVQVPWAELYAGTSPKDYVNNNYLNLVNYYRSKNLKLWLYIDPVNGLDRTADASDLAALGKSISQPQVQQLYSRFVFAMDSILKPDHLGLALETNAIRGTASNAIYQGVKNAANNAASVISAFDKHVKLSVSIQADYAWGLLNAGPYQAIDKDFSDFPFIQELGISSYPYFVYDKPQDIPDNYYSRLVQGHNIPVFISEGWWSSQTVDKYTETPQKQQDYITRQDQLLGKVNAIGYFQLLFSDIGSSFFPPGTPDDINLFTHIGLVDTSLNAKPALKVWDGLFKRPLKPGTNNLVP